jgi:hypothetical protein
MSFGNVVSALFGRGRGAALFVSVLLAIAGCTESHRSGPDGPVDRDGDGYDTDSDCDDGDASIHPGASDYGMSPYPPDPACPPYYGGGGGGGRGESNGLDDDCDGAIDEDVLISTCNYIPDAGPDAGPDNDGDGYPAGSDCNDSDPNVHPGAEETCCDSVDQNCDGYLEPEDIACNCFFDADGDGYGSGFGPGPDCNDSDPTIHPDAPEVCGDGIDQNCDGSDGGGGYEYCGNGVDDDCDGLTDEDADPDGTNPCIIINGMADAPDDGESPA